MRIAFIDLLFSWPPHGGADVDVFHVAHGLQRLGHAVHLFGARSGITWERGDFDPQALPFPATRLDFPAGLYDRGALIKQMRSVVDAFQPDCVCIGDSFFLKPFLIEALAAYPQWARFYAHEILCQKDILKYRDGKPCPHDYLSEPEVCRPCGLQHLSASLRAELHLAWHEEYLAAEAYRPEYWELTRRSLGVPQALITYNPETAAMLKPYASSVAVIPAGVDIARFPFAPPPLREVGEPKVILMAGRGEDPVKGASVLLEAGRLLSLTRSDFHVHITMPETTPAEPWFSPLPWCDHNAMVARYQNADICVAPSLWEEPFGMVALEAMACGRPVVVSNVGGLRTTIEPGVSGLSFPRGHAAALAACLAKLLDDATLRAEMGQAARHRAETAFAWDVIIGRHYLPLLPRTA